MEQSFKDFKSHVLTTKHSVWFDYHSIRKQQIIFHEYVKSSGRLKRFNKTPSLRKFLYNIRQDTRFSVPKKALRKNILKDILQ